MQSLPDDVESRGWTRSAIGSRATRRGFLRAGGSLAAALSGGFAAVAREPDAADGALPSEPLLDYVKARDPSTRRERSGSGDLPTGRWISARLTSQTWRGIEWNHQLCLYRPASLAGDGSTMILWIDGGKQGEVPEPGSTNAGPPRQLPILAAAAEAAGMPAAVVRQVPNQPLFDGRVEDDLIAHTFEEFLRSGDATWPLLLPMAKTAVEAMTAATALASEDWGLDVRTFVVTGASKRGWTTWLTAAADERVVGLVPMVIDMLDMERHIALQVASFGAPSDAIHDYTSRGIDRALGTPRGRELVGIVDPFSYREVTKQPKIVALGTNDAYWPLESLDLYYHDLEGPRWVSYAPNSGHGLPLPRIVGLVAGMGRHAAGIERLPEIEWAIGDDAPREIRIRSSEPPAEVTHWFATSGSRDFRKAAWNRSPASRGEDAVTWTAAIDLPSDGFSAHMLECRFDRRPQPLLLTSGISVHRA